MRSSSLKTVIFETDYIKLHRGAQATTAVTATRKAAEKRWLSKTKTLHVHHALWYRQLQVP